MVRPIIHLFTKEANNQQLLVTPLSQKNTDKMVSAATQAKVEADNSRLEGAVRVAIDEIDKVLMRPIAKKGLQCSLKCYDTIGQHGTSDALQHCVQTCEQPHQKANAIVRQVCYSTIG